MENNALFLSPKKLHVGDRVELRGLDYQGGGQIEEISTDSHFGSSLYPSFKVALDNGQVAWLSGISLRKE